MKICLSLALAAAITIEFASAHPSYARYLDEKNKALLNTYAESAAADTRAEQDKRSVVSASSGGLLGGLVGVVGGAATSVLSNISPDNYRPQAGYVFQEPDTSGGPGVADQRGPCPALNLLANYGYLPRNGIVSYGQILEATAEGFNMGTDLAAVLATFAVLANGDVATETFSLGGADPRVPNTYPAGGLNRHSTVEADISPNKEDFYLGCGDNHHISSRRFSKNVEFANAQNGKFDFTAMANHYAEFSKESQASNPYLYYFPFPSIVSVVAYNFYSAYFSNGTYGAGGDANYRSISSIIGANQTVVDGNVEYEYVAERWPEEGWYRRATEYGAVQALTEGFTQIYPANPVPMPFAQVGTTNFNAQDILCDFQQGIASITPLILSGSAVTAESAISWALAKLDPYFSDTVLGCSKSTISNSSYFPANKGGALDAPPSVSSNTGTNQYNQVYFPATAGIPAHC